MLTTRSNLKVHYNEDFAVCRSKLLKYLTKNLYSTWNYSYSTAKKIWNDFSEEEQNINVISF